METTADLPATPLGFVAKMRVLLACIIAIVVMRTVGWMVARPVDPDLAVTFVVGSRGILAVWPALWVLSVATALVGTVIGGRRLPEAGVLAAGVGLTALALRGGSMETLLGYVGGPDIAARRTLMVWLAVDGLLWAAILASCWVAVWLAWRWLWPEPAEPVEPPAKRSGAENAGRAGWPALAATCVVALLIIWLTIARTPVAATARGQVIASVTAGFFLAAMAVRYYAGIHDARWYALAPLGVALVAYLLGYLNAGMGWTQGNAYQPYAALSTTPPHDLVRALPIEYLAVGIAAAMAGFWSGQKIEHVAEQGSS